MEAIEVTSSVNNSRHNSNATPNPVENNGVIKEENQINRNGMKFATRELILFQF